MQPAVAPAGGSGWRWPGGLARSLPAIVAAVVFVGTVFLVEAGDFSNGGGSLRGRALSDGYPYSDGDPHSKGDPYSDRELAEDAEDAVFYDDGPAPTGDAPWHDHVRHHLHPKRNKLISISFFVVHVALTFGVAYALDKYSLKTPAMGERSPEVGRAVFAYGLFDEKGAAGSDRWICLCSFLCMPVQWADTLTKDKVSFMGGNFWLAVCLSIPSFQELNHPTAFTSHLIFVSAAVYFRQKLREKFGLEHGTPGTIALDFATWCYCCCCAAAQEARQVEYFSTVSARVPGDYGFSGASTGGAHPANIVQGSIVRPQAPPEDSEDARE